MVRMEEAVVKQGFLHLQQHQTFGKVRARLGRAAVWRRVVNSGGRGALHVPDPAVTMCSTCLAKNLGTMPPFLRCLASLLRPQMALLAEGCLSSWVGWRRKQLLTSSLFLFSC